jgi:hypothetical protein
MKLMTAFMATAILLLSGCASAPKVNTASGQPEVLIKVPSKQVLKFLANTYSASGFQVMTLDDFTLVVEKFPVSQFARTPDVRVTFRASQLGNSTRILARVEMITNSGSGIESIRDLSAQSVDLQISLEKYKHTLEGGVIGIAYGKDFTVTGVIPAGPAYIAGIQTGDKIERVSGASILTPEGVSALNGPPDTEVKLVITRNGRTHEYSIVRKSWTSVLAVAPDSALREALMPAIPAPARTLEQRECDEVGGNPSCPSAPRCHIGAPQKGCSHVRDIECCTYQEKVECFDDGQCLGGDTYMLCQTGCGPWEEVSNYHP